MAPAAIDRNEERNIGRSGTGGFGMIDIKKARRNLDNREALRKRRNIELFHAAEKDCLAIVEMIKINYQPVRIYQWGSLLDSGRFNEDSDIDLATEGIVNAERFFSLLGDAMKMTSFKLDIVQIEKIEPEFAESIRMTGRVVYERS